MPSVKKNALYNSSYQVIRLLFPIFTYPYVSRILGPTGVGSVSYAQSIANYFTSFILLGIPLYAGRAISQSRINKEKTNQIFSEILLLSIFLTIAGSLVYGAFYFLVPGIAAESKLHWGFGLVVLFYWAQIDWFYRGIEEFRLITIRNLIVRIVSAGLIFIIIKQKDHYYRYAWIWIGESIFASLWNLSLSSRFIEFRLKNLHFIKHLKASIPSALIASAGMLYAVIDTVMLGAMLHDNNYSVGLYSIAGRLMRIAMSIVLAVIAVVTPNLSLKHEKGEFDAFYRLIQKNINFVLFLGLPLVIGMMVCADELILLFAGNQFKGAVLTMRILAPNLLLLSLNSIFAQQFLYSRKKDKEVLMTSLFVLIVGSALNFIFIPGYKQDGAAFATFITRCLEGTVLLYFSKDIIKKSFDFKSIRKILISTVVWSIPLLALKYYIFPLNNLIVRLLIIVSWGIISFVFISLFSGLTPAIEMKDWILKKRGKRK